MRTSENSVKANFRDTRGNKGKEKGRAGRREWAGATEGIVKVGGPKAQTRRARPRCDSRIRFPTEPAMGRAQQYARAEAMPRAQEPVGWVIGGLAPCSPYPFASPLHLPCCTLRAFLAAPPRSYAGLTS